MTSKPLPASAQRVQDALTAAGTAARVIELPVAARTSQQAADALGVEVGQIAKSLIFRAVPSGRAVLVIAAGDRRVDEARIAGVRPRTFRFCDRRRRAPGTCKADDDLHRHFIAALRGRMGCGRYAA